MVRTVELKQGVLKLPVIRPVTRLFERGGILNGMHACMHGHTNEVGPFDYELLCEVQSHTDCALGVWGNAPQEN